MPPAIIKYWHLLRANALFQLARENQKLLLLMVAVAVLPLLFSTVVVYWLETNQWLFELQDFQFFLIFTLMGVFLIGLALTPSTVFAILCGYYLGIAGLIPILLSYPMAALIGFYLGKVILHVFGLPPFHKLKAYQPYMKNLKRNQFKLVAYMRLSPVMPFAMINLFLATLPLNLITYSLASVVGMLPRTLVFFWGGMNATEVWAFIQDPNLGGAWNAVPIALVLIALIGLIWVGKRIVQPE